MRLIEKALLGITAIGTAGAIGTAAMQGAASGKTENINSQINQLKTTSGYIAANYEFKSNQIAKLMQDYRFGLLSEKDLVERVKEEHLSELDFDAFAKNEFNTQEYQEYLRLKDAATKNNELEKLLPNYMIASITLVGMSVGMFTCKAIDGGRKPKSKTEKVNNC